MRSRCIGPWLTVLGLASGLSTPASAQAVVQIAAQAVAMPAAAPAAPSRMLYGPPIGLGAARRAAAAAEAKALSLGFDGAVIAIVQPDGTLVFFEKLDNATYASVQIAVVKARTAALLRHQSGPSRLGPPMLPDLTVMVGGTPLTVDGRVVGAIGVSGADFPPGPDGAPPAQSGDLLVAAAAAAALKETPR